MTFTITTLLIGMMNIYMLLEVRNKHITRGRQNLVSRYDGEMPTKYLDEVLKYLDIKKDDFKAMR